MDRNVEELIKANEEISKTEKVLTDLNKQICGAIRKRSEATCPKELADLDTWMDYLERCEGSNEIYLSDLQLYVQDLMDYDGCLTPVKMDTNGET